MAARSNVPVIFLEHKGLYQKVQAQTNEPDAEYVIPFGNGRVVREGKDLTIVAATPSIWPRRSHGNSRPKASRSKSSIFAPSSRSTKS
jgi:pyruvate/2-oxoglutarate/acetoin dehydrogenase E1 component